MTSTAAATAAATSTSTSTTDAITTITTITNTTSNNHKSIYDCVIQMSLNGLEDIINEVSMNCSHTSNDVYKDHDGNTALHIACINGNKEILEMLLLYYDGDVTDITNDNNRSAVNLAAHGGYVDLVKMLIEEGCHIDITNDIQLFTLTSKTFSTYKILMLEVIERQRRDSFMEFVNNHLHIYRSKLLDITLPNEQTTPLLGWNESWLLGQSYYKKEINLLIEMVISKTYFINENDNSKVCSSYEMLLSGRNDNKVQLLTTLITSYIAEYIGDYERQVIDDNLDLKNSDTLSEYNATWDNDDDDDDDDYDGEFDDGDFYSELEFYNEIDADFDYFDYDDDHYNDDEEDFDE